MTIDDKAAQGTAEVSGEEAAQDAAATNASPGEAVGGEAVAGQAVTIEARAAADSPAADSSTADSSTAGSSAAGSSAERAPAAIDAPAAEASPAATDGGDATIAAAANGEGPHAALGADAAGHGDSGDADAGGAEAGSAEAGSAEAGSAEAGGAEAGSAEAGSAEAGSAEAGSAEAGSAEAGDAEASDAEAGAAPEATPSQAAKKKKRRRRRKKKGDGAEAEAAGSPSSPQAASPGASSPRAAPSRPDRAKAKPKLERPAFNVGDEVFGRVSQVTRVALWLDVAGGKALGLYDRDELIQVPPRPGEQFIAKVKSLSTRGGMLMLGRELWDPTLTRAEIRAALEAQQPLDCFVTGVIKGGLEVDYKGVRAFAPASHVELRPGSDLSHLLGEKMSFVVTQYGKKGRDVVVSRKQMLESEHNEKRAEVLAKLEPDLQVKAVVRNVLQWGAFVSLPEYGDLEGVVHMTEASHDRSARLSDVFRPGAEIEVKVLKIDDKGKLWLSHKATQDDPWGAAEKKYAPGTIHAGKVVRLTDFGAFVQLEPGIDGLCHVADLSPFAPIDHPKEAVAEGADLEVIVAHVDGRQRKITLHPAPPAEERDRKRIGKLAPHQKVDAVVMQIRDAGLGVRIVGATGRYSRAFIPAGQTGTPRGTDLRKEFPLGKTVEAKVIEADRRGEARLSIRALKDDAEKQAYREYRKKVQREATFGTFGDLLKGKL